MLLPLLPLLLAAEAQEHLKAMPPAVLQAAVGGALGMSFGLLLETSLLIIRANRPPPVEESIPHMVNSKQQRTAKAGAAGAAAAGAAAAGAGAAGAAGAGVQGAQALQQGSQEVPQKSKVDKKRE
jgi:hypothetical protein